MESTRGCTCIFLLHYVVSNLRLPVSVRVLNRMHSSSSKNGHILELLSTPLLELHLVAVGNNQL